jgi:hypothetical protein
VCVCVVVGGAVEQGVACYGLESSPVEAAPLAVVAVVTQHLGIFI